MNWKEHINLFANGKFKLRFDQDHAQYNLEGEIEVLNAEMLFELERIGTDCTLIARKIEDMSDEERQEFESLLNPRQQYITVEAWLYLLSIGVYPFDQSAFDNGDVINIRDLEQ